MCSPNGLLDDSLAGLAFVQRSLAMQLRQTSAESLSCCRPTGDMCSDKHQNIAGCLSALKPCWYFSLANATSFDAAVLQCMIKGDSQRAPNTIEIR